MSSHASTRAPKSAATPADDTPSDTTPDRSDDAATTQPVQEARNVVEAIVEVMRLVKAVGKDGRNTQSNYNFRGIDGTMNAVGPAMRTVGLICIPHEVRSFTYGEIEVGAKRTKQAHAQVQMTYRFVFSNAAGEISTLDVHVPGEAMDSGDKATAKAMSVAYRTCLLQSLTLPTQERDPDADTYERSPAIRAEEIRETVEQAKRERDPVGFLVEWGNRIGEQRLAEVELEVNGEATNGAAYLHRVIAYYQAKGEEAAQARAAAAAQEAHEGVTRDVREDTTAPAAPAAPVEQEAPRARSPTPPGRPRPGVRPRQARATCTPTWPPCSTSCLSRPRSSASSSRATSSRS